VDRPKPSAILGYVCRPTSIRLTYAGVLAVSLSICAALTHGVVHSATFTLSLVSFCALTLWCGESVRRDIANGKERIRASIIAEDEEIERAVEAYMARRGRIGDVRVHPMTREVVDERRRRSPLN
jgi:hypothetical protein